MTWMDWFWAGFWATCGVGWALLVGLGITIIITLVVAAVTGLFDR